MDTPTPTQTVTVTMQLSEPVANELRDRARHAGVTVDEVVRRVLERSVTIPHPPLITDPEKRANAFLKWAESHPRREGVRMDDSRESICEGRECGCLRTATPQ